MLVVYFLRTGKIPFLQSSPSRPLLFSTLFFLGVALALPYIPKLGDLLGFVHLDATFYGFLAVIVVLYCTLVQLVKTGYQQIWKEWYVAILILLFWVNRPTKRAFVVDQALAIALPHSSPQFHSFRRKTLRLQFHSFQLLAFFLFLGFCQTTLFTRSSIFADYTTVPGIDYLTPLAVRGLGS